MNIISIYKIENLINGKTYIGQSRNTRQRIYTHRYELTNNKHKNEVLQRAWNKYGKENFKFEIIEECHIDDLNTLERKWIVDYNSYKDNNGYNLDFGGNAHKEMSQETRDKISLNHADINGENNPFYGKHHSDETKQKISDANKGRKMSEEVKQKNRLRQIGSKRTEETKLKMSIANKGKLRSEETKRKISESKKGKKTSKVIKVICITTNDIFNCIEDGVKKYGINESNIINCCKGKQKWAGNHPDTGEKMIWMYYEDYILQTEQEVRIIINNIKTKRVILLNTKEIFNNNSDASKRYETDISAISSCCNNILKSAGKHSITGEKLVWMFYDEYITKTEDQIIEKLNNSLGSQGRKIICITTNEIFNSILDASRKYKINSVNISECCTMGNRKKSAGKHPETKDKMVWQYYNDYLNGIVVSENNNERIKNIICITTDKIFESAKQASEFYGIPSPNILLCCKGKYKKAGKHPETKKPMIWMYLKDYEDHINKL